MQKLQKAALAWIATHVTNDEVSQLKDVFRKIDKNNDGTITLKELDECIENGKCMTIVHFFSLALFAIGSHEGPLSSQIPNSSFPSRPYVRSQRPERRSVSFR